MSLSSFLLSLTNQLVQRRREGPERQMAKKKPQNLDSTLTWYSKTEQMDRSTETEAETKTKISSFRICFCILSYISHLPCCISFCLFISSVSAENQTSSVDGKKVRRWQKEGQRDSLRRGGEKLAGQDSWLEKVRKRRRAEHHLWLKSHWGNTELWTGGFSPLTLGHTRLLTGKSHTCQSLPTAVPPSETWPATEKRHQI